MATTIIRDAYPFFVPLYKAGGTWKFGKITKEKQKAEVELAKMPSNLEKHLAEVRDTSAASVRRTLTECGVEWLLPKEGA